jgi:hypothetical protein
MQYHLIRLSFLTPYYAVSYRHNLFYARYFWAFVHSYHGGTSGPVTPGRNTVIGDVIRAFCFLTNQLLIHYFFFLFAGFIFAAQALQRSFSTQ